MFVITCLKTHNLGTTFFFLAFILTIFCTLYMVGMEVARMNTNVREALVFRVNSTSWSSNKGSVANAVSTDAGFQCTDLKLSLFHPRYLCLRSLTFFFLLFLQCLEWLWKRTQCYLSRNNTLWRGHNCLWHNVKSSQLNVASSHCQQIESWAQLEGAKLWLIVVRPYRWKGRSGIVGSSRSGHQFVPKWKFQNSKASSASNCLAGVCVCAKTVT